MTALKDICLQKSADGTFLVLQSSVGKVHARRHHKSQWS